jgi:hypothetical protein
MRLIFSAAITRTIVAMFRQTREMPYQCHGHGENKAAGKAVTMVTAGMLVSIVDLLVGFSGDD